MPLLPSLKDNRKEKGGGGSCFTCLTLKISFLYDPLRCSILLTSFPEWADCKPALTLSINVY
jgi:hypothetical protein